MLTLQQNREISQNNILQNFAFIKHLEEHKERSLRLNSL